MFFRQPCPLNCSNSLSMHSRNLCICASAYAIVCICMRSFRLYLCICVFVLCTACVCNVLGTVPSLPSPAPPLPGLPLSSLSGLPLPSLPPGLSPLSPLPSCDRETGQCECLPRVKGRACDRCVLNHWRLAGGRGCEPCDCAPLTSLHAQCNEVSLCTNSGLIIVR